MRKEGKEDGGKNGGWKEGEKEEREEQRRRRGKTKPTNWLHSVYMAPNTDFIVSHADSLLEMR